MFGFQGKFYYSTTLIDGSSNTPDALSWTALDIVKDVTIEDAMDEVEVTTRAAGGNKQYEAGLRDVSITTQMNYEPADAGFQALLSAYTARNKVAFAEMDGDITTATNKGVVGNYVITAFGRPKQLGDRTVVDLTLKPFSFVQEFTVPTP